MSVDISIILTCYKFESYIERAIRSLLTQNTSRAFEVIVINDASPDGSKAVIDAVSDSRLRVFHFDTNIGANAAVQFGFQQAKGAYVCRFDGDDYWHPDYLEKAAAVLDTHSDIDMVYTDIALVGMADETYSAAQNVGRGTYTEGVRPQEFEAILRRYYIPAPSIMARRTAWNRGLPIPSHLTALDWYLSVRILQQGKAYFIPEPLAYYRIHNHNMHHLVLINGHDQYVTEYIMDTFVRTNGLFTTAQKQSILADNYIILADKYFGSGLYQKARQCYLKALRAQPKLLSNGNIVKHLIGACAPRLYNALKKI